jgi:hypothetical protein
MAEIYECRQAQLSPPPLPPLQLIAGIQSRESRALSFAEWEFALNVEQKSMAGRISAAARFPALRE